MKLKRILLLVISLCGIGIYASAQQVTIDAQSVRLEQILDEISDQTGFSFYYSRPTVDPDALCSVSARNQELTSVLDALFSKSDITYDIRDSSLLSRTFTFKTTQLPLNTLLEEIEYISDMKFELKGDIVEVSRK